jgi:medium-chain acyl-[acyl-carrier-protein] hydrolase
VLALETYAFEPGPPLDCAVSCFGGEDDRQVPLAELEAWSGTTRGAFRVRQFPGGHFFLDNAPGAILAALRQDLAPCLSSPERCA